MSENPLNIVFLGQSITSSWANGHAATYRALLRELAARGHHLLFLERDQPWYAKTRDVLELPYVRIQLYQDLDELKSRFENEVRNADCVIVGSGVPEGVEVGEWILSTAQGLSAFYDLETPITLAKLQQGSCDYLSESLISRYQLYLSSTGGPMLEQLEREFSSPMAKALYGSVDHEQYHPEETGKSWDLGFLGTYSEDRQAALQSLLIVPASRWPAGKFAVAGAQYPSGFSWPENIERIDHLAADARRDFLNRQLFTLNLTRREMAAAGYSPSTRLFEAAACGVCIITDYWEGLEDFFEPGEDLLIARTSGDVLRYLQTISSEEAREIGQSARKRVLSQHTAAHRAAEFEELLQAAMNPKEESHEHEAVLAGAHVES